MSASDDMDERVETVHDSEELRDASRLFERVAQASVCAYGGDCTLVALIHQATRWKAMLVTDDDGAIAAHVGSLPEIADEMMTAACDAMNAVTERWAARSGAMDELIAQDADLYGEEPT